MAIDDRDIVLASNPLADGQLRLELSVPGVHCGGCIHKIESTLSQITNVTSARVNLSTKRLTVQYQNRDAPPAIGAALEKLGFDAHLSGPAEVKSNTAVRSMLKALAVAAFAAMNIMMLSVAVWAGADSDTRQLFHLISAFIAFPALVYSGRVFYLSAWKAVRHGTTNMDVPISIGLIITYAMSLYDTVTGGEHAYFDAATMLLFFLLIGRTLDYMMRERAHSAINGLQKLIPLGVDHIRQDNTVVHISTDQIEPGMLLQLAAGDRIPVNGIVESGRSDIDLSLVSGESEPVHVHRGSSLVSGALNLTGPFILRASAPASGSYLADMIRLMERAEQSRSGYTRLADRFAALYAPLVHLTALIAFGFWMFFTGDPHHALTIAVSVLIITCPCALALAVPMVQITAARRLFDAGILIKDGSALERLNEIGSVIFDKTGTLTSGELSLLNGNQIDEHEMLIAASLAAGSRHPYARSISAYWRKQSDTVLQVQEAAEVAGSGLEGCIDGHRYRLGRNEWASECATNQTTKSARGSVLTREGQIIAEFDFEDGLRPESLEVVHELRRHGLPLTILSGDAKENVSQVAAELGVDDYHWGMLPDEKLRAIETANFDGQKPLMVGDGINDAAALAAAHVSIAPASTTDVGRAAADIVLLKNSLIDILTAIRIAKASKKLIHQNMSFAVLYNLIAIPFAFLGYISPLYAAIAMSTSSIVVVMNAMRLNNSKAEKQTRVHA